MLWVAFHKMPKIDIFLIDAQVLISFKYIASLLSIYIYGLELGRIFMFQIYVSLWQKSCWLQIFIIKKNGRQGKWLSSSH